MPCPLLRALLNMPVLPVVLSVPVAVPPPLPALAISCSCLRSVVVLDPAAPQGLRLPLRLHILQHGETNARSTALHAALMAPADVQLHRHAGSTTSRRCDPLALQVVWAGGGLGGALLGRRAVQAAWADCQDLQGS